MKKILIIEDDELFYKMIQFKLRYEGYSVFHARDEKEGIEEIRKQKPNLVLADLNATVQSGLDVINYIKKDFPQIPVIIMTSFHGEEDFVEKAISLGASDFISKPFNPGELVMRIRRFL